MQNTKKLLWEIDNMADKKTTRYMELQMQELKATIADEETSTPKSTVNNGKNAEIAALYEDAAEYEKDLEGFEEELIIVNANKLKNIAAALTKELPSEERNYAQELKTVLEASWTHLVEVEKSQPKEQLELIKATEFCDVVDTFNTKFPDYNGDFEKDVRAILTSRWKMLIAIKKEHLKEEIADIKISGLKPTYAKRIYKQYHGIE